MQQDLEAIVAAKRKEIDRLKRKVRDLNRVVEKRENQYAEFKGACICQSRQNGVLPYDDLKESEHPLDNLTLKPGTRRVWGIAYIYMN
jgi:hypothetical protein